MKEAALKGVSLTPLTLAQELYQALFQKGLQQTLHQLQGSAHGEPILLRLNPVDLDLHGIPWEALCRPETTVGFLGTSQQVSVARGASSLKPWEPCQVKDAVRLRVISPSDEGAPERLKAVLHPSLETGELEWLKPLTGSQASVSFLLNRLRYPPVPHILHFICHGGLDEAGHPTLRLADKEGQESWLKVELLAQELESLTRDTLRLVVLEACEGARPGALASAAALLAQAGVGAVVAHLWPVRADVARRCSAVFYRSLAGTAAHRGDVARSLHDARRTLLADFRESAEAFSPVLYLRGHEPILFDFRGRTLRQAPSASAPAASSVPVEPAARALLEMLQKPCSLLLGDHGPNSMEALRQALHAELQGTPWETSSTLPLSALAQRYALQFGDEALNTQFQTVFQEGMSSMPLVDVLARRLGPGVHITLLRAPVLEEALARHHPSLPLYVLQPARSDSRSVLILQQVPGQGWVKLKKPPEALDLEREAVVLRCYRGHLPNRVFSAPLLTEDDFLLHVRKLEETLPPELATPLKSVLARQPALVLGLSLLSWEHRHLLYSLYGRRPLPEGSTVLREPGDIESEAWRSGQGLPGGVEGGGTRLLQAASSELAEYLDSQMPGGAR
ncbi:CHAT domain-containing protein [Hyalangium versicolor]|uniref:CHAT domain-containing protein n=1 Tax=Hyalangium versicolor TaxID=2861190 RepID=UPI001CC9FB56|nr:CHAT domain-containing protein [Hyalangium versicolor]